MATRVLIINRQLVFAVTLKQALEQTGSFDVHPFTTADAAFDFLREHPQDVALVDFTLPGRSGAKVIQQLRAIQSDLAVIISPRQPDADAVMDGLRLQGMIDMPFGARDIIPLIERAVEQAQQLPPGSGEPPPLSSFPPPPQTTPLDEKPPEPPPQITTKMLGDEDKFVRKQFGTTQLFSDSDEEEEQAPAQTRQLDEPPQMPPPPPSPFQTRNLREDELPPSPPPRAAQTRRFDDSEEMPRIKPLPRDSEKRDTGENEAPPSPIKPLKRDAQTRRFDDSQEMPRIKPLRRDPGQTANLNDPPPPPPPQTTPELSSLESVLQSFGFDPPTEVEDTPSVPMSNSDALRQFLATADQSTGGADQFDDVLGSIDPTDLDDSQREETPFEGLVKSMQRSDDPQRPQKLTDFTLTSGMDAVLREIARSKTAPLTDVPPAPSMMPEEPSIPAPKPKAKTKPKTTFEKLAQEEPPPPAFEESGTVGDLMLGVSDSGFRNVLSLLRGDEQDEAAPPRPERQSKPADPFADFFAPPPVQAGDTPAAAAPPRTAAPESRTDSYQFDDYLTDDEPGSATVAQVILQTALEETQLPDGFSLNQLLTDIENRLSMHKLAVKPLPSWNMDTGVFRPVSEAEIREPDFLPEEIPPGEVVSSDVLLEFDEPESYTGRTTRASLANQWVRPSVEPDEDTLFDSRFVEETTASESVRISEAAEQAAPEYLPDERIEDTARSEVIEDEGIPTGAFLLDEIAAEPVADSWHEEPEMQEGASFLAPLLKNAPPVEDMPASPAEEAEEDVWDFPAQPEWVAPEFEQPAQSVQDIDWGAVPDADDTWEDQPEEEVEEAAPDWTLPTDESAWDIAPQESAGTSPFVGDWEVPAEEAEEPTAADDWQLSPAESEWEVQPESVGELLRTSSEWELPEDDQAVPEDPYLAQLALNLTQFSLESSSEGSILTRGDEIVAYAGHLSEQDTIELRDTINNDWDANPEGARIRFITLPSSGMDYMLYSIRTDGDLTLSMIFAGTTPLRVIRQQGQRLIAALESIPEVMAEEPEPVQIVPVETPIDETQLSAYSFVWLMRNPESHITDAVAQAMMAGLSIQLRERGWKLNSLQVHEDFVYLFAGVPGETSSHEIMRDLKRRSADIAHAQDSDLTPQMLWADAYLILAPGRELQTEEILEFINFQRMA
jgi:CheY-like chemotaxis protein